LINLKFQRVIMIAMVKLEKGQSNSHYLSNLVQRRRRHAFEAAVHELHVTLAGGAYQLRCSWNILPAG
jgi:hypothetical protein